MDLSGEGETYLSFSQSEVVPEYHGLPFELWIYIFEYLVHDAFFSCMQVCKYWYVLLQRESLWENLHKTLPTTTVADLIAPPPSPSPSFPDKPDNLTWHQWFKISVSSHQQYQLLLHPSPRYTVT